MSGATPFFDPEGKPSVKQYHDRITPYSDDVGTSSTPSAAAPPAPVVSVQDGSRAVDVSVVSESSPAGESDTDDDRVGSWSEATSKSVISDAGSSISIDNDGASETITIRHHKGGNIRIGADGSITIQSTGSKGFSLNADKGNGTIAVKGRLVIDADDIVFQSKGDMQFHGKNFRYYGTNQFTSLSGSMSQEIDGGLVQEVGHDITTLVGGSIVQQAGKQISQQATEAIIGDTNNYQMRATESATIDAGKHIKAVAGETVMITAKDNASMLGNQKVTVGSSEGSAYLLAAQLAAVEGMLDAKVKGKEVGIHSLDGSIHMDATNSIEASTKDVKLSASDSFNTYSQKTYMNSDGEFNIDADGAIDIRGSTIDFNKGAPAAVSPKPIQAVGARKGAVALDVTEAKYPDTNTIVDSITTRRLAPEYENNAYDVSKNQMAIEQNNGASVPEQAVQSADQNSPGSERPEASGSEIRIPSNGRKNNVVGEPSPYPPPGTNEVPEQLSKNVLAFPGIEKIPGKGFAGYEKSDIIGNIQILCHNIIDKVIDKFGSQVSFGVNGGFRLNESDTGHNSGNAVDIHATNKMDTVKTLEIANWIKDNCYFDELRIEMDAEQGIHIHVEIILDPDISAAPAGEQIIKSCKDFKCESFEDDVLTAKYATIKLRERDR